MQRTNDTHDVGYDDEPLYVNFIQYFYMINNRQIGKNIQANKQNFHICGVWLDFWWKFYHFKFIISVILENQGPF